MNAIILAAGQGTRLHPHTLDRPKCMVPLVGRTLLARQLATLRRNGIENITVIGGYQAERLEVDGATLTINPRFDRTNMVATLFCASRSMGPDEDLLISYGDILYEDRVLSEVLAADGEIVLAADRAWRRLWQMRMDDPLADAETFRMASGNKVTELGKKPRTYDDIEAQYMGLIRVRHDCVKRFKDAYQGLDRTKLYDGQDFDNMYMTSFLQVLIDAGWDVRAALVDNGWLEVDTTRELEIYESMARDGRLDSWCRLD